MKISTNSLTASDGVTAKTYYFSAGSTLLFLQYRQDGWYHWRDDNGARAAIRLKSIHPAASILVAANKALGMYEQHLEVSLQMTRNRKRDLVDGVTIDDGYANTRLANLAADLDQARAQSDKTEALRIIDRVEALDIPDDATAWEDWEQALNNSEDWLGF